MSLTKLSSISAKLLHIRFSVLGYNSKVKRLQVHVMDFRLHFISFDTVSLNFFEYIFNSFFWSLFRSSADTGKSHCIFSSFFAVLIKYSAAEPVGLEVKNILFILIQINVKRIALCCKNAKIKQFFIIIMTNKFETKGFLYDTTN